VIAAPVARGDHPDQIVSVIPTPPPYALAPAVYRFPALTAFAGRAPLGGERELGLACLMVARLAAGALQAEALPVAARRARSSAARTWLASLALPPATRDACTKVADACASDASDALRVALTRVIELATGRLDAAALSELRRVARGSSA
jgi:hypothetical protein